MEPLPIRYPFIGVARILLEGGAKQGVWGTEVPSGVRGNAPVGVWGQSHQKLETYRPTECITVF